MSLFESFPGAKQLPLHVYVFPEGVFVVDADQEQTELIGSRLLAIGDTPAEEALRRVGATLRSMAICSMWEQGGDRGASRGGRHHVRRALAVGEVALSVVLVFGAGLLIRTVYNLQNVDAGFTPRRW